MKLSSGVELERALAPRHWTRWIVVTDAGHIGTIEKRGMGSGWYAHGRDGRMLGPARRTRADALELLTAGPPAAGCTEPRCPYTGCRGAVHGA